jgi:hypothetical protein
MNIRNITAFATGAVFALVLGTGTAYAANGGNFKLGGNNYESREASLNNSNGTALTLRSKAGTPPLKVNRTTKAPNLNADLVDGLSSSQIARVVTVGTRTSAGFVYDNETPGEPGDDLVVAVTECPGGTQVMGGGADNLGDGVLVSSFPDTSEEPDLWVAISSAAPTDENAADFQGFARCWDPNGNVADSANNRQAAPGALSPSARKLIAKARTR